MSIPMPSPSMKGMIGLSETLSTPSAFCVILSAISSSYGQLGGPLYGRKSLGRWRNLRKQRVINLARRGRAVERIKVQTGCIGVQQLPTELGGRANSLGANLLGAPALVSVKQARGQRIGYDAAHGPHAVNAGDRGNGHNPG